MIRLLLILGGLYALSRWDQANPGISGQAMKQKKVRIKKREYNVQYSPWFLPFYKSPSGAWRSRIDRFTREKCGVYLIRSRRSGRILYVGYSTSNLKKILYRHFYSWEDDQKRAVYADRYGYEVMVITAPCSIVYGLEQSYIEKHKPRDNDLKFDRGRYNLAIKLPPTEFNTTDPTKEDFVPF